MKIAIIDADIVGKPKHRFPNLCCMKISAYHKSSGDIVTLKTDYDDIDGFDKVYISKVFTDTEIPCEPKDKSLKDCNTISDWYADNEFLKNPNIEYGGTGFFYDKAPKLPDNIEHIFPDYHLYDEWIQEKIDNGCKRDEFTYYLDYSIGFLTRGCFRKCAFCVNRNYNKAIPASPLSEFMDESRKKLCFLDDNFFGCANWEELIKPVEESGKRFQFKQGLDERLLTKDKIEAIGRWKYDGDYIFAFDNIADKDVIVSKLEMFRNELPNIKRRLKFYVFCGYDRNGLYDEQFWHDDIRDLFERIYILKSFDCLPYVMRYEAVYDTEYSSLYSCIAAWCNQPSLFRTFSFDLFCKCRGMRGGGYAKYKRDVDTYLKEVGKKGKEWMVMESVGKKFPDLDERYFHNT